MNNTKEEETFSFQGEQFADIQMLHYRLPEFETLSLRQKKLIYSLSQATLFGRDITFDQFGKYNLRIRKTLEAVYKHYQGESTDYEFQALGEYLKQVWFASGIHHHYACDKFIPSFTEQFFRDAVLSVDKKQLPLRENEDVNELLNELCPVIFDPTIHPKRVNKADGVDLICTSACNYYEGVNQQEVENYYAKMKAEGPDSEQPSYGLNSTLIKKGNSVREDVWKADGKYSAAIKQIIVWLERAKAFTENEQQHKVISLLIKYYETGDLRDFDRYSIEWLHEQDGMIDFINGFIEVYGDPMGLKGSWEGIVEYKDLKATHRTQTISANAQWFEDHSPVNPAFRKPKVKGVTANVICAAMLGGDEYPASAIGINLPNADWIRAEHGSKSVTISNLTHAYDMAAKGNGFREEFVIDEATLRMMNLYSDKTDDLHTDLHECLGHGSGRLLPGTDPDALKNYGNTIEEARADLFGLYYIADEKLLDLGLLDSSEAYKAQYYGYMMNGLLTQQVRIKPGKNIEEAHMQNRALIAWWAMDLGSKDNVAELIKQKDAQSGEVKTFVRINDYAKLREIFAQELAEIQRIKSEGDFEAARKLVETYAVKLDKALHAEVLQRYERLKIAPYKGFINPVLKPVCDATGEVTDIIVDYSEGYTEQMLRYSEEYATLI
ncbi:dipeptidyl peptidase 3 [Prevotella histicola]|uniref:dipeptidyl-peptidase 3 family protein n=1 Tax=Prevotella histicola TaxID=470565 RepID=UPI001C5D6ECE|nr:dipeptidyl peptidase 3 [Prevotella histicola]MBW4712062.1 dipeptidyl peptidase 3 [Prevotella histicola]MBW4876073.1 dipeptidyl peptidase 3 [Prevotella histicola]MBW4920685.1 dipeptidyl peptidase 3 [Prevotella histicola]